MSVKKTNDSIHLYWAHNTESFALGSMTSEDSEPHAVMSRASSRFPGTSHNSNHCTSGGRAMRASGKDESRHHPAKKQKRSNAEESRYKSGDMVFEAGHGAYACMREHVVTTCLLYICILYYDMRIIPLLGFVYKVFSTRFN